MELWLGPSQRGSRFRDEAELREARAKNRDRLMEWWGSSGRRPMAWWEFEAGDLRYPGYDRERSFLFERGLFADAERAECHTGVRSSTAPTVPVCSTARVRGNFSTVMPPVAPTSRGRTFHPRSSMPGPPSAKPTRTAMPDPLALHAELAGIIRDYALPLMPSVRSRFYERVCAHLSEERELGPGSVSRACRRAQAEFVAVDAPPAAEGGDDRKSDVSRRDPDPTRSRGSPRPIGTSRAPGE